MATVIVMFTITVIIIVRVVVTVMIHILVMINIAGFPSKDANFYAQNWNIINTLTCYSRVSYRSLCSSSC